MTKRRVVLSALAIPMLAPARASPEAGLPEGGPGLGAIAATRGILYGAAVGAAHIANPAFAAAVRRECAIIVGENDFKWRPTQPQPDQPTFGRADAVAGFAAENRLRLRGHTMIWQESLPPWVTERLSAGRAVAEATIRARASVMAARYRGRIMTWDVVNEAVGGDNTGPEMMRDTPFHRALGESFLDIAFAAAREADPDARLAYNDFGLEQAVPWQDQHRSAVLRLLERLLSRGVPVDTLGIQAHLQTEWAFDATVLSRFLRDVAGLGLHIEITELDVDDRALPAAIEPRDAAVADLTRRFLDVALAERRVDVVMTWGLSDRHSWLSRTPSRQRADGNRQRGLPLDEEFRRKPMWQAMAEAFRSAPPRG